MQTNPLSHPTESGWYVVEWRHEENMCCDFFYINIYPESESVYVELDNGPEQWEDFNTVTRFAGPIDPKAYLDEGGKE